MTAGTYTARPATPTARRRPVSWARLAWVAQRQRRGAFAGTGILLGVLAVYLLIMAILDNHAYAAVAACHPAAAAKCQQLATSFRATYWGGGAGSVIQSGGAQTISSLLFAVPVLLGAFVGAPVLARELESGTFRFAWTQGAGRTRWTIAALVVPAVAATAATGAFTALFYWYFRPFLADGQVSEMLPLAFALLGVAFAAWTLFAFAVSAFLGAVTRRTLPAMGITLVVYIALAIATATDIRPHYATPVTVPGWSNVGSGWVISNFARAPNGSSLSAGAVSALFRRPPPACRTPPTRTRSASG